MADCCYRKNVKYKRYKFRLRCKYVKLLQLYDLKQKVILGQVQLPRALNNGTYLRLLQNYDFISNAALDPSLSPKRMYTFSLSRDTVLTMSKTSKLIITLYRVNAITFSGQKNVDNLLSSLRYFSIIKRELAPRIDDKNTISLSKLWICLNMNMENNIHVLILITTIYLNHFYYGKFKATYTCSRQAMCFTVLLLWHIATVNGFIA